MKGLKADIFYRMVMFRPTTYAKTLENTHLAEELLAVRYKQINHAKV